MTLPQEVRAWPSHHPSIIFIITPSSNFNVRNVGCVRNLVLQMQGAERPSRVPLTLFTLNTPEAIKEYAFGCDADVGGTSTVHFDFDDHPARAPPDPITTKTTGTGTGTGAGADAGGNRKRGAARFHGEMRLGVRPGYEDRIRGGYAGFRNKVSAIRRYVKLQKKTLILFFFSFFKKKKVPPDVVWRAHRRRIKSPISRSARACGGPPAYARLVLRQRPNGGPDRRRSVAAPPVLCA